MPEATKRCCTCHLDRPLGDYNVLRSASDGRQPRCRDCAKAWYLANRTEHKANVRARNIRVRAQHKERLATYLLEHPCVDCGEDDLRVLDFDHEDPSQKMSEVVKLVGFGSSWTRVESEIAKCSVRCANCHRRRTAEMFGYWRAGAEQRRQAERAAASVTRLASVLG